ncbi:MAG TPA: AraC family transcriptional regulator [Steroidobacteraceae bacterium]|nr:AraC family transcriptional regulator [Steroidobacteraceae bacterium]
MDLLPYPLRALLELLRPRAVISRNAVGKGDWSVRYEAEEPPSFCIVLAGRCWIEMRSSLPELLHPGDVLLRARAPAITISGQGDFAMLGGTLEIQRASAALLMNLLPERMCWSTTDMGTARLERIMDLIVDQCARGSPKDALGLPRLIDLLLLEALRTRIGWGSVTTGLLAGLRDPTIAQALKTMHSDVGHAWVMEDLGTLAGLSRAGFVRRFTRVVGIPPMDYLARWRMSVAVDSLLNRDFSLKSIARTAGYDSASAFSTAFRARVGCAPGTFARGRTDDQRRTAGPRRH